MYKNQQNNSCPAVGYNQMNNVEIPNHILDETNYSNIKTEHLCKN